MRALAAAVIAVAALPATAGAATWSPPQRLSGAHLFVDGTGLTVSDDGRALATWRFQDAVGNASRTGASSASRPPGADAFGTPRALVPRTRADRVSDIVVGPAAYGRDRALMAAIHAGGTGPRPRTRLDVAFGRTDGSFGRRRVVRRAVATRGRLPYIAGASLSVNSRGDAALAWFEDRGVRTDRVYVALRRAGRAFSKPQRLATGRIRGVAAAIGAGGHVLVAWDNLGVLRTRFKTPRRARFLAAERIRSEPAFFAQMHPAVNASGRAVLAWSAQFASEGGEPRDAYFQAAIRPIGKRFGRAVLLERISPGEGALGRPIDTAIDTLGTVAIAWSGSDGANRRVRAVRVEPAGTIGPAQDVSPPGVDGLLSDLAAGPAGRLLAVWDGGIEDPASTVGAALAPAPGQPFGLPELVSPAGQEARFGVGAFAPDGRATVVYSNRPEGSRRPVDEIRTYAEASTRSE